MQSLPESLLPWQRAWRQGLVPQLTTKGLQGLKAALERNDSRLIQGSTMMPPPLMCMLDEACEALCGLCWALNDGEMPYARSVGPMEQRFAETCLRADDLCGEPAAARYFLNWFDETPREQMRTALLAEVDLVLRGREQEETESPLAKQLKASMALLKQQANVA
jgi:hypothetical protein